MELICEAYLYAASRAQTLRTIVKPEVEKGSIVIADRSFLTSYTNQAYGREIGIKKVMEINKVAIEVIKPDIIVYLDLPIKIGISRVLDHDGDKFECLPEDFYKKVERGYRLVQKLPEFNKKWISIDANGTEEEVFERIKEKLLPRILSRWKKVSRQ
jgi:dTMP kinase